MDEQIKLEKKRAYDREWKRKDRIKNPEKVRAKARLKDQRMRQDSERLKKHQEYMRTYQKKWRENSPNHRENHRNWMREWYRKHAKEIYRRRRQKSHEKLAATIRSRMKDILRNGYFTPRTEKLLGCSYKELKEHLEKQFKDGMNWDNYGFYGWHADHIKPLSSFDFTKKEEMEKAFHYTNLQPLWAKENLTKGARVL